jgi:hypothetical protein
MAKTNILEVVVLKGLKGVFSRKKNSINNSGYYRLIFFYIRKKLILTMKIIEDDCYKLKFRDEIEKFEGAN